MLACTALVGCTDNDVVDNNEVSKLDGEKAYVVVKLNNAEGVASRGTDNGLSASTTEHAIATADFYFYSANGTYVTEGRVATEDGETSTDGANVAIEYKTKAVVVLNNLTQKGTPKYVLAVLNKPSNLSLTNLSITQVQEKLLEGATPGSEQNGEGFYMSTLTKNNVAGNYFIMTNSTYNGGDEVDNIAFFATAIDENQFYKQPEDFNEYSNNPVEIYVERLAAKVGLTITNQTDVIDVVVENNDADHPGVAAGTYKAYALNALKVSDMVTSTNATEKVMQASEEHLYALVYGWDLNATNKKSYLMKNVPAWNANLGFTWDEKTNYRANWCYSWNYNEGTYPANYKATDTKIEKDDAAAYTLNYVNWNSLTNTVGYDDYCAENTNSENILIKNDNTNFHAAVTEVLVKARIVDENGTPVTLFRYDNVLYTEAGYLEKLFEKVNSQLNIYRYIGTTQEENTDGTITNIDDYKKISSEDVEPTYVNEGDGKVSVTFALKATAANYTWGKIESNVFTPYGVADNDETTDKDETVTNADDTEDKLNEPFEELFEKERNANNGGEGEALEDYSAYVLADHYNGGMMYYNIPIEHLRVQTDGGKNVTGNPYDADGAISVLEAEYGVVRNHWYKITINDIANLGSAVHDADEDIIPDESENVLYYIAARINVLSWKVVNQSVEL